MDADRGPARLTPQRRRLLRLALLLSFFIWLFVRPLRESVSVWVPFAAFAGLEAHFFASGILAERRRTEAVLAEARAAGEVDPRSRGDLAPQLRQGRDETVVVDDVLVRHAEDAGPDLLPTTDSLGEDGSAVHRLLVRAWPFELAAAALTTAWLAVDDVRRFIPGLLVLIAASLLAANLVQRASAGGPARAARRRHPGLIHLRDLAVVAVVAGAVFLMVRPTGWEALPAATQLRVEQRLSAEAARISGRPATLECDDAGNHTGVRTDADGAAIVGGSLVWLAPDICNTLHDLAFRDRAPSFDRTSWAVLVLAHEAWHLRGEADEGLANCFGMQSGVELGQRLGLSPATAARMMAYQYGLNATRFSLGRAEYLLPEGCTDGGEHDLDPGERRFP